MSQNDKAAELLRAAVEIARKTPTGTDMMIWCRDANMRFDEIFVKFWSTGALPEPDTIVEKPPCGVVGCLAYKVCIAAGDDPKYLVDLQERADLFNSLRTIDEEREYPISARATELLGEEDAPDVFDTAFWSNSLRKRYYASPAFSSERVEILALAVEAWIKNGNGFGSMEDDTGSDDDWDDSLGIDLVEF